MTATLTATVPVEPDTVRVCGDSFAYSPIVILNVLLYLAAERVAAAGRGRDIAETAYR